MLVALDEGVEEQGSYGARHDQQEEEDDRRGTKVYKNIIQTYPFKAKKSWER